MPREQIEIGVGCELNVDGGRGCVVGEAGLVLSQKDTQFLFVRLLQCCVFHSKLLTLAIQHLNPHKVLTPVKNTWKNTNEALGMGCEEIFHVRQCSFLVDFLVLASFWQTTFCRWERCAARYNCRAYIWPHVSCQRAEPQLTKGIKSHPEK